MSSLDIRDFKWDLRACAACVDGCVGQVSPPGQGLSVWEGHEGEPSCSEWQHRHTMPVSERCQGFRPYLVLKNTWWDLNGIFKSVARADVADRTNRNLGKRSIDIFYFLSEQTKAVEPHTPEHWQLFSFESLTSLSYAISLWQPSISSKCILLCKGS